MKLKALLRLPTECPGCGESLEVTRLTCPQCAVNVEGKFVLPELLRLEREEQEFVLEFVRTSGSLKKMGEHLDLSYPTVRNRLDEVILKLASPRRNVEAERKKILDSLARGELSVKEATRRLEALS